MFAHTLRSRMAGIRKQKFLSHVAALMTGAVIAQAVPVLLSPVLTRVYEPQDFASFAIFTSICGVLSVVGAGRYDEAILLPREEEDALSVVALSWIVLTTLCLILTGLVVLLHGSIPPSWEETLDPDWLYLLPVAVFVCTSFQILANWNNRRGLFPRLAVSRAAQGTSGGLVQCGLGYSGMMGLGLVWGWLGGQLAGMLMLLRTHLPALWRSRGQISRTGMAANARTYRRFPLLSTWGCVLGSGGAMMALLIVSQTFSSTITGWFSFTLRVLALPLFLISNALAQVLHQRIARMNNEDPSQIQQYVLRTAAILSIIAVPFVIVLSFFGVELFTFAFGRNWSEAGKYAGILSVAVGIRFIVSPLTAVLSLNQNVKSCVQWQVLYFLSVTVTLSLGTGLPIEDFLKLYVAHEVVLYSLYFLIIIKASRRRPEPCIRATAPDSIA